MNKNNYFKYLRESLDMIKFEHTLFALPFAFLAALSAAQGLPPMRTIYWIMAAMVGARTAAMTFNRIVDQEIDAANPRTAMRALPAGRLPRWGAWLMLGLSTILFGVSAGALGPLCWKLSPLALVIILGYSLCKRFTSLAHVVLGLSLSGAPLGAWLAITNDLALPAWLLAGGVLCWTTGFDILYALQDLEFDQEQGLHSVPARLGVHQSLWLSRFLHITALVLWGLFNIHMGARLFPWLAWLAVAGILAREQWLVKGGNLEQINQAFFTMNSLVGLVLFSGHFIEWTLVKLIRIA